MGLGGAAEYPGFKAEGFTQQCQQACRTGKTVDYASFSLWLALALNRLIFQASVEADNTTKPSHTAKPSETDTPSTATPEENKPEATHVETKPDTQNLDAEVIAGCDAQMQTAGRGSGMHERQSTNAKRPFK